MKKDQRGFSVVEGLLVLIIIGIIGFIGWYVWHHSQSKPLTQTTVINNAPKKEIPPTQLVTDLQSQLPAKFNYLTSPKIVDASFSSNLTTGEKWYVNVKSSGTGLTFSFTSPSSSGLFQELSSTQQKTLNDQTTQVINYIAQTLINDGYTRKQGTKLGVVFDNDKAGYYVGTVSQCMFAHWQTLPIAFELHCASNAAFKTASENLTPFVEAFAKLHPERDLNTVEVEQPIIEKSAQGYQYALLSIGSPDAIDTHPTDGLSVWVNNNSGWQNLSADASVCTQMSELPGLLSKAHISDTGASATVNKLCDQLGP